MAIQSVSKSVPGLSDLLIASDNFQNPKRVAQAAFNARHPLLQGIAAIGELLFIAGLHSEQGYELDGGSLQGIGLVVKWLAETDQQLAFIESNANFEAFDSRMEKYEAQAAMG